MVAKPQIVEFLEKYPLYRKLQGSLPEYDIKASDFNDENIKWVAEVTIELPCPVCKKDRTFASLEPTSLRLECNDYDPEYYSDPFVECAVYSISYCCTHCKSYHVDFILLFDYAAKHLQKIGQNPPWSIAVPKDVERFLGDDVAFLKRGKICESQGYGIAAFVYYRRVVENVISSLLNRLENLIPEANRERYSLALRRVQESRKASEKIQVIKDLLPSSLRPDNRNPLGILYDAVSQGLHQESDEECLRSAAQIHTCLTYLIREVSTHEETGREFTDNIQKLLDKTAATKSPAAISSGGDA
ncbi:MAG: hypothetical protein GY835_19345 [bacterium]|nr:hypothetical protein [bacterium]